MNTWLPTLVCLLFLGEAAWRIQWAGFVSYRDILSTELKATAFFNAANFIAFALLGFGCLAWPSLSRWFGSSSSEKQSQEGKDAHAEDGPKAADNLVVVVDKPSAKSTRQKSLEVETSAKEEAVAEEKPPQKGQLIYLTNMKTFLTFIVVMFHIFCSFQRGDGVGLGTWAGNHTSFILISNFWTSLDQKYFMAAFYLISGYFCPKSLDRKGFRKFVLDKLVRLGGPFILFSMFLGPLLYLWQFAYASAFAQYPLYDLYYPGPTWFILWLLNYSILYAVIAQVLPKLPPFKMPHPFLLVVLGLGLGGAFYGLSNEFAAVGGGWIGFGSNNLWNYVISLYIPFFIAGCAGGRNNWLKRVEEMKMWEVWGLRALVVGFWVLNLLAMFQQYTPDFPELLNINLAFGLSTPVYAIAMTLAEVQLFHQYFNSYFNKQWLAHMGAAAYTVYVIHPWVLDTAVVAYVEILKAAGVPIEWVNWRQVDEIVVPMYYVSPEASSKYPDLSLEGVEAKALSDALSWAGFIFVFVVTELIVWPLAHYFRKLPVLNKMF